jgi:hypothetical protein
MVIVIKVAPLSTGAGTVVDCIVGGIITISEAAVAVDIAIAAAVIL